MKTMTPEERFERIERQLEFLAESQGRHDAQIGKHDEQIGKLADVVASLARIFEEQGRRTDERLSLLPDRLNTLINMVERYFSDGHK